MSWRRGRAWLAAAVLVLAAAPAAAQVDQGCAGGVTVVVDFAAFGGAVDARCVEGAPASGLAALEEAGFSVTMVQNQPGFVCRIDGEPADDPCVRTPPADAYWGYWHADAGAPWGYATAGAASRVPPAGTVEGWAFSTPADDGPPSISPEEAASAAAPAATATTGATTGEVADDNDLPMGVVVGAGVLAILVAAVVVSALRRRRR